MTVTRVVEDKVDFNQYPISKLVMAECALALSIVGGDFEEDDLSERHRQPEDGQFGLLGTHDLPFQGRRERQ